MMRLDPALIRHQIENLKVLFPDLSDDEESWTLTLESETDVMELLKQTVDRMREAAGMAGGIAERIALLEIRQERYLRRETAMRWLAQCLLSAADLRKVELPEATLSLRSVPPSVIITDQTVLPKEVCKIEIKPDKTKIKELLKQGPVPGASMSNGSETLSVRTK